MSDNSKDKKPDIVVWDKERGYYAKFLSYGSNIGAPAIQSNTAEVSMWKQAGVVKVNHYFQKNFDEIKQKYTQLIEEFKYNEMLYNAKYSFEPIIGETYYLYSNDIGELFLSLINPKEWKNAPQFIGAFKLDSGNRWEKIFDK
jgi:hypothetical protein